MVFSPNAQTVYADGPAGSPLQPAKSEIRKLLKQYENVIEAFLSNGGLIFASLASLNASLNYAANSMAWVLGDATVANNGIYRKVGSSGTGSWTRVADLPFSFIIASDAGAGTANAIQATTSVPVSASALVWMNISKANTSSPVTVSFNGGSALTMKTNSGHNIAVAGFVAGMIVMGIVAGATFRLVSDQASGAIVAAAEAAQVAAEAAQAAAEAAAAEAEALVGLAETALQTEQEADFVGGGAYLLPNIFENQLNLLMTNPSLADGADVSAKVQALVNAAAAAKKTAFIPAHPLGFSWRFDSQIDLPANTKLVFDPASKSRTHASVKTFRVMGSRVYLDGGFGAEFSHVGDGEFLDTNQKDAIQMRGFRLDIAGATTKDGIIVSGSDTYIEDNAFGSFRGSSYVIRIAKKAGQININNKVVDNYFGGPGRALSVSSEEASGWPEGVTFSRNKSVLTGTTIVQVETVLSLHMSDNMLDQGSGAVINLASTGVGIQGLTIDTSYIAAAQAPTGVSGGVGIRVDPASVGIIDDVRITKNEFAWSAYGISLQNKASNVTIDGNSLFVIDQIAISADADRLTLRDNTYGMAAGGARKNLVLTEKAGGGHISIENEKFDAAGTVEIPALPTRSRWNIGRTFGKVLRKISSATAASPANQAYLPVPHGLIRAPGVITGLTVVVANGATYANLRCFVMAVDATNVTVQIWHDGAVTPGNITVFIDASV